MSDTPRPDSPAGMPPLTNPSSVLSSKLDQFSAKLDACEALLHQILEALGAQNKGGGLGH